MYRKAWTCATPAARQQIVDALGDRARVAAYDFNWQIEPQQPAREPAGMTRLVHSVQQTSLREDDLQAIILLTDGNDTAGDRGDAVAPILASRKLPVYPVVFGSPDSSRPASAKLSATPYVRLGDELRVTATLRGDGSGEQIVTAQLMEVGREQPLAVRENLRLDAEPVEVSFIIRPEKPGRRTYRVVMQGIKDALSPRLLASEQEVDVLPNRIRVLYLDIPRDERKILGHWLARDPVVDLAVLTLLPRGGWYAQGALQHKNAGDGLPNTESDLYRYDVIILGDIPRAYFREGGDVAETKMQRLAEFVSRRGGGLVTLGGRSVYGAGQYQDSALDRILPFAIPSAKESQIPKTFPINVTAAGLSHPLMQLEWEPQANKEAWLDMPLLDGCNFVGAAKPGASVLAVRDTEQGPVPVIALQNVGRGQVLGMAIDTTWRWEMMRPAEGEDYFRRFWGNVVRTLAPDPRVEPNRPQVLRLQSGAAVGQTVTLATRLVDSTYRPVTGADVVVEVTSPSGSITHIYPRDGREAPGLYQYSIPLTEPGRWQVSVTHDGKTAIETINAGTGNQELDDPRAKPAEMQAFAEATGGKAFTSEELPKLIESLDLRPRQFAQSLSISIWNLPLTMIVLIALVCLDTLIRKRRGMV
jgi:uncharacterized membrane protein